MIKEQYEQANVEFDLFIERPVKQRFIASLGVEKIAVLLAPSGAGKTSLFNAIAGLAQCVGSLAVSTAGQQLHLPAYQRQVAYVTQSPLPFEQFSVAKLIKLVAGQQAHPFDIQWALAPLGLADKLNHCCNQLSGGQRQRLALLLAMIKGAPLLLLDEVLTGLDQASKTQCIAVIRHYLKVCKASALVACHQLEDVLALADCVLLQLPQNDQSVWQMYPVETGLHHYQQTQLMQTDPLTKQPCASQFISTFSATTMAHHAELGLNEYQVGEQTCFAGLNTNHQCDHDVTLMLKANRVGLAKQRLQDCSFVNQLQVQIEGVAPVNWQAEEGMLVEVSLQAKQRHLISVWITRLSYLQLQPKPNEMWFLIGKADALSSSGGHQVVTD